MRSRPTTSPAPASWARRRPPFATPACGSRASPTCGSPMRRRSRSRRYERQSRNRHRRLQRHRLGPGGRRTTTWVPRGRNLAPHHVLGGARAFRRSAARRCGRRGRRRRSEGRRRRHESLRPRPPTRQQCRHLRLQALRGVHARRPRRADLDQRARLLSHDAGGARSDARARAGSRGEHSRRRWSASRSSACRRRRPC